MPAVVKVIVLFGPPGSGKSTVGAKLGRRGLRWRDWERWILHEWGGTEAFVAGKPESLARLHAAIEAFIDEPGSPAVFETTGLSDAPFLDRLQVAGIAFVARLDVSEAEAERRVASRPRGEHLRDEPAANRAVREAWDQYAAPGRSVDLALDTTAASPAALAEAILAAAGVTTA